MICAPVDSAQYGLSTQVPLGLDDGLKHESALHCDELVSLPKGVLTDFVGTLSTLSPSRLRELDRALIAAVGIEFGTPGLGRFPAAGVERVCPPEAPVKAREGRA